jgi:hypothetical protein
VTTCAVLSPGADMAIPLRKSWVFVVIGVPSSRVASSS